MLVFKLPSISIDFLRIKDLSIFDVVSLVFFPYPPNTDFCFCDLQPDFPRLPKVRMIHPNFGVPCLFARVTRLFAARSNMNHTIATAGSPFDSYHSAEAPLERRVVRCLMKSRTVSSNAIDISWTQSAHPVRCSPLMQLQEIFLWVLYTLCDTFIVYHWATELIACPLRLELLFLYPSSVECCFESAKVFLGRGRGCFFFDCLCKFLTRSVMYTSPPVFYIQ